MLKLIGAIIVIASTTSYGFYRSAIYKKRVLQLKQLIYALNRLKSNIQYNFTPLPDAFLQLSDASLFPLDRFFNELHLKLSESIGSSSFEQLWNEAIYNLHYEADLQIQHIEILKQLGAVLGTSDTEDQLKHIQHALDRLELEEQIATEEQGKYSSLWRNLGALVGVALVILLI